MLFLKADSHGAQLWIFITHPWGLFSRHWEVGLHVLFKADSYGAQLWVFYNNTRPPPADAAMQ